MKEKGHEKSRNPIYHPTLILEPVWKGTLAGKWHEKGWNPQSYHPKFTIAGV